MLTVNADDLGLEFKTSNRIISCYNSDRIHSASGMVFMADSERAADLALSNKMPTGLHLNFDQPFTSSNLNPKLIRYQTEIKKFLQKKFNQVIYNPFLKEAFEYVFYAQWDEFIRLYGDEPKRIDGHHHMHLCMNMLVSFKYPKKIFIRRNFSFKIWEKNPFNIFYRYLVDRWLNINFQCQDYFFSITPIKKERLEKIILLSKHANVELMVHPGLEKEFKFLMGDKWLRIIKNPEPSIESI